MNTNTQNTTKYKNSPLGLIPEDWEVKRLNEVTDYVDYRGKTPQKKDSGILLVTSRNIKQGYIDYDISKEYISENDYDNVMSRGLPEIGDVVATTEAPMGNVAQINRIDIALAQRVIKFRAKPNIIANDYLKYYLLSEKFQRILDEKSTGGTVKGIKGSTLHKMILISPPLPEQKAIANCLSTWDAAIEKHAALIAQKELSKKALMQQLLSGKKRLKGFSGEWKEVRLGDLGDTYNGLTGKSKEDFGSGFPFITYMNIFLNSRIDVEKVDFVKIDDKENQNKTKYGDIFFTVSSETPNEVGMTSVLLNEVDNLYLNSFCFGFRLFDFISLKPEFAIFLLRSDNFRKEITILAQGSTRFNLSKTGVKKILLTLPSIEEQTAIANVLQCADAEIQLLKSKLAHLKEQKKGLMQVLLTGKKRLKY